MHTVVSEIGAVLRLESPTRKKIQEQNEFLLRYKGFEIFFSDLRWLKNSGPSISIQFKKESTKFQSFLNNSFSEMYYVIGHSCNEIITDLKEINSAEINDIKFISVRIKGYESLRNEPANFWLIYPSGFFNSRWNEGSDISPLMITAEFHSNKFFISFLFNPGGFARIDEKTQFNNDWRKHCSDISDSINAYVERNYRFNDDPKKKTFEEWSEDMVIDFGDEIIPKLPEIWNTIRAE